MFSQFNQNRIYLFFRQLGCNHREVETYLTCLQMGPAPIKKISEKMNSNRITVHSIVEQLIKKGFLFETFKGKKRLISAENPSILYNLVQQKYNDLKLLEVNMDYIAKLLNAALPKTNVLPAVRFYEGLEGLKKMLEETIHSAEGEVLVFENFVHFAELFDNNYIFDYFKRKAEHNITSKLIFPESKWTNLLLQRAAEYKFMIRLIDTHVDFRAGFVLWNNHVALNSHSEAKITSTIIENGDLSFFFRNVVFESLWKTARPTLST